MEELPTSRLARRSKKPAARSAYDDVFGGPPRYAVPFAGRQEDYAEIFGDVASSCSIPFLDLPPAVMDGSDARVGNGVDYGEIFGGFDFEGLAVSSEELFEERKREEIPSLNGRVSTKKGLSQQKIESSDFPAGFPKGDRVPYLEEDQLSFHSYPSDEGVKQFNESYNMTSQGRRDNPVSRATYRAQPHADVTYVMDSCDTSQNVPLDNPPKVANSSVINGEQGKICPPRSSSDSTKSPGTDSKADWKEYKATNVTFANGHAHVNHHKYSSSNHSASSGDVLSPDVSLLSISEINLRTRPLRVPPPSRPPPKVLQKQEELGVKTYADTMKPRTNHQPSSAGAFSKSHSLQEAAKSDSPRFLDVEVDASSAAAASAAAMKEAMELAQARLKSAKELMERKRDSFQSRKKQGRGSSKYTGNKESQVAEEVGIFKEAVSPEKLVKEHKIHDFMLEEKLGAAQSTPYYNKEGHVPSSTDPREEIQRGSSRTSQAPFKLEKSGKWKSDDEFYELTNGEEKYKTNMEDFAKEVTAEKSVMAKIIQDKENNKGAHEVGHEVEGNEKPWESNEKSELDARYTKLKVGSEFCSEEEIKNTPSKVLDASVHIESKLEEVHDSQCEETVRLGSIQENNYVGKGTNKPYSSEEVLFKLDEIKEMPNTTQEACVHEVNVSKLEEVNDPQHEEVAIQGGTAEEARHSREEVEKQYANGRPSEYGGSEKIVEPSEICKFDGVHGSDQDESKLKVAEEACEVEDNQNGSNITDSLAYKTDMQNECEKVNNGPGGSCLWEEEKPETTQVASQSDYYAPIQEMGQAECPQEENVVNLESTGLVCEQEEIEELNCAEKETMLTESIPKVKEAPEDVELKEDLDNLETAQRSGELEKETEANADSFRSNYSGKEAKEALSEDKQNTKKHGAEKESPKQESCVEQTMPPKVYEKEQSEEFTEGKVTHDFGEEEKVDAATYMCRMAVNTNLEDQQAAFLEKRENILRSAQDIASSCTVISENFHSGIWRTEEKDNAKKIEREQEQEKERTRRREEEKERERKILREREEEKERARKLEEEKEREREREKDRLAVERATREAHERAFAEARERAEKIAMERVTSARQRASAEAREKSEKVPIDDVEKSLVEKAAREARLRAERAAVERATAEARERAIEKAMAEKAAADSRERMGRFNSSFKEHSRGSDQDVQPGPQFQKATSSNSLNYRDSSNQGDGESALRCKARLERHQRTVERAAKALAEKNMRDILAQREQAEKHRMAEYLDADIKRWSNGKEGNLRALLSTLQYILGPESGWQPIPLTDVITAAAVKKAYRKATLCVHPDKLQQRGASIQQKYICEKVFDLLKEAWNRFNSEER